MKLRIALVLAGSLGMAAASCRESLAQQPGLTMHTADSAVAARLKLHSVERPQPTTELQFRATPVSATPVFWTRVFATPASEKLVGRPPSQVNFVQPVPPETSSPQPSSCRPVAAWNPVAAWQTVEQNARVDRPLSGFDAAVESEPTYRPVVSAAPLAAGATDRQSLELQELYARVLALEGQRENRSLIERARIAEAGRQGVDVTDEQWVHTWGGRIHSDWVNWANDAEFGGQPNYVEFRRLRLFASGEGYGVFDYELQLEFAPETELQARADPLTHEVDLGGFGVELKDAYLGMRDVPYLGYVRVGHFKTPFGLSELTSSNNITFMERALPHIFAPGREMGVGVNNHTAGENVTWAYGAFFDEMDEMEHAIEEDNQGIRFVGRVTWTPFYDEPSQGRYLVHTGIGYVATRDQDNRVRFRARPEIHRGDRLIDTRMIDRNRDFFIDGDDDIAARDYQVLGAEFAWVNGPLSIQSELTWMAINDNEPRATDLYGAYIYVSYFLTGEHRRYNRRSAVFGRVIPHENFWIVDTPHGRCAGWGAWEVAARWSYLDFSQIVGQELHDVTLGLNWYWNPNSRMMLNWIHPFDHDISGNAQGNVVAMRLQFDF